MKRSKLMIFLLTVSLAVVFTGMTLAGMKYMPGPDAGDFWNYITKENPYLGYQHWPGKTGFYKGQAPHGAILRTFVNPKAYLAIGGRTGEFPPGSIIVKENYSPQLQLAAVTTMYKVKGYDPAQGDWFWVKYGPRGEVQKSGMVKGCINCHSAKKDNDWVFTGMVK